MPLRAFLGRLTRLASKYLDLHLLKNKRVGPSTTTTSTTDEPPADQDRLHMLEYCCLLSRISGSLEEVGRGNYPYIVGAGRSDSRWQGNNSQQSQSTDDINCAAYPEYCNPSKKLNHRTINIELALLADFPKTRSHLCGDSRSHPRRALHLSRWVPAMRYTALMRLVHI